VTSEPVVLVRQSCQTGEGPLWHPDEQCLYWLDIPNGLVFRHVPATGETRTFEGGAPVGGMTLQRDGALALFMAEGSVRIWRDGVFERTVLDEIPEECGNRFNDVIADPEGRVFCGTMPSGGAGGRLYAFRDHNAGLEFLRDKRSKLGTDNAPLVMPSLVPGVGEKQLHAVETGIANAMLEHLYGVVADHPDISQLLFRKQTHQITHAGAMHLDAEIIIVGLGRGHLCQ
jgi:hypothetical protein